MFALLTIESIRLKRNLAVFLLSIGMPVLFFLIFSSTIRFDDPTQQEAFVRGYLMTMTGFSMSGFALFTFPTMLVEDRHNHWLTFVAHSPLRMETYYLSKLFRVFLCFVSSIIIVFLVGALVKDVNLSWQTWLVSGGLLLVSSLVFLAIGLLLSHLPNEQTITVVGNLLYFILAIMGGSWMPISLFPDWVQSICKLLPSYHANQLVTQYAAEGTFAGQSLLVVLLYAIIIGGIALCLQKRLKGS